MAKVERDVRICDRCKQYYEVTDHVRDWQVTYLNKVQDICDSCYDEIVPVIRGDKLIKGRREE